MPPWLVFVLSGLAVVIAGSRLAREGDAIARRTSLGATWVGAILVAGATSLPEIATDVAAVRQGESALAVGDLFGSSMANMVILAVADLATRRTRLLAQVTMNQAMVGALAISLTCLAAVGVLADSSFTLLGIGWAPLAIAAGYVLGMRLLHQNRGADAGGKPTRRPEDRGLRRASIGFAIAAGVILAAAPHLAGSAATLADQWGLSSGFFGVVFLAAATSLPEASSVFAAVRAGAHDLAVGNLLGSNAFNMLVLVVLDAVDGGAPLLAQAEGGIVVGALFAMLLMGQVLLDLLNRAEERVWFLEPGPALVLVTYAAGLFLTYRAG